MAELIGNLWEYNIARVVIVDVSDDYRLMQPSMPSDYYPVITEKWLPRLNLNERLSQETLVTGYLYDWHEGPQERGGAFYVGVVSADLASPDFDIPA